MPMKKDQADKAKRLSVELDKPDSDKPFQVRLKGLKSKWTKLVKDHHPAEGKAAHVFTPKQKGQFKHLLNQVDNAKDTLDIIIPEWVTFTIFCKKNGGSPGPNVPEIGYLLAHSHLIADFIIYIQPVLDDLVPDEDGWLLVVFNPEKHKPLKRHSADVCQTAGVPEHLLWESMDGVCNESVMEYVREIKTNTQAGLVFSGQDDFVITKMQLVISRLSAELY